MAPGPLLALVIAQVLAQGGGAVLWILAGHAAVEAVFVLALARGFNRILDRRPVRMWLSLVGGGVLIWMGWTLAIEADRISVRPEAGTALSGIALFLAGAGVSLSNPYFTGWWATVGAGQVAALRLRDLSDYGAFFLGHELGDAAWYAMVAALLSLGRQWVSPSGYRFMLYGCAGVLTILGALFAFLAFRIRADRREAFEVA